MNRKLTFYFFCICFLFLNTGCSLFTLNSVEKEARVKPVSREAVEKNIVISKESLNRALSNEHLTSRIRAVEVFQNSSGAPSAVPNYRLFDVGEGSVYELLGLQEIDILVSVNERIVVSPGMLGQVVRLLPREKGIVLEVIREGKTHVLRVSIVG